MLAVDHGILDREEILNRKVRIQVWDTAGQERFRNITKNFFKKADGLLLVYDCTNPDTLENISSWVSQIEQNIESNVPKILLANKHDLPSRSVDHEKGQLIAQFHNMGFFSTSAKTGFQVSEAFTELARQVVMLRDTEFLAQLQTVETEKSHIGTQGREALRVPTEQNASVISNQISPYEGHNFGSLPQYKTSIVLD